MGQKVDNALDITCRQGPDQRIRTVRRMVHALQAIGNLVKRLRNYAQITVSDMLYWAN